MDDELDQEGMEEESSGPAKSKGSPLKMIIIIVAALAIAVAAVFGFILPTFFPTDDLEEEPVEEVIVEQGLTEYGVEFPVDPTITVSTIDKNGRVRNVVIDITFETSDAGVAELTKRSGQIRKVVKEIILSFKFEQIVGNLEIQDSIQTLIKNNMNMRLPMENPEEKILSVSMNLITQ